MDYT